MIVCWWPRLVILWRTVQSLIAEVGTVESMIGSGDTSGETIDFEGQPYTMDLWIKGRAWRWEYKCVLAVFVQV